MPKPQNRHSRRNLQPIQTISGGLVILIVIIVFFFITLSASKAQPMMPGQAPPRLDHATQAAIIDSVLADLNRSYVFPDKAAEMDKLLRRNLKKKEYQDLTNIFEFTNRLTEDLHSVFLDAHLWVQPIPPQEAVALDNLTEEEQIEQRREQERYDNYGFRKVERLSGNIGYLRFDYFADAVDAGATAIAALNFLANTDALIIDLRENGGGRPSMIQLITSYFFSEPQHLNDIYIRESDKTHQFWTPSYVAGPRMTEQPIFILTSRQTFSGAEEFTYNLKNMERATIIGETTGGGAHFTNRYQYTTLGIVAAIPFGRAINPITGTNWEGTGIEPHIAVPASEALDVALLEAYKALLETTTNPERRCSLEWAYEGLQVKQHPTPLPVSDLQDFTGTYGPRRIWIESGELNYQREGRMPYRLMSMGDDKFLLPDLDRFRIQFVRDETGRVVKLIGLYDSGFRDENIRTGE